MTQLATATEVGYLHKQIGMPAKVAHVVLAVRDPRTSAAFYTDVLGMQWVWDKLNMVFFSFGEQSGQGLSRTILNLYLPLSRISLWAAG